MALLSYIITTFLNMSCTVLSFVFVAFGGLLWRLIERNVQYNGGSLPDIILLTQGYNHWGTHLNAMKRLHF